MKSDYHKRGEMKNFKMTERRKKTCKPMHDLIYFSVGIVYCNIENRAQREEAIFHYTNQRVCVKNCFLR